MLTNPSIDMKYFRLWVLTIALLCLGHQANAQRLSLIAGGDVEWSRVTYQPDVYHDNPNPSEGEWRQVPYLNSPNTRSFLREEYTRVLDDTSLSHHKYAIHYDLSFDSDREMVRYPFREIASYLREGDLTFVNLETPLSNDGRWQGAFRTPEVFAEGIYWAGIDVVSMANNHALDAGGEGLMDTMGALDRVGVEKVGAGTNLEDATEPVILERNGITVAFLAYTAFENSGTSSFAQPDRTAPRDGFERFEESPEREKYLKPSRSGVAPMDPFLIERNIDDVRDEVDHVVVSLHWNIENSQETHPGARKLAKRIVDMGADAILGHHPHVPRGIEVYKGSPIFYSIGNFIFGHNHDYWMDNYLARIDFSPDRIEDIKIRPVAGEGQDLSQPYLLEDERAEEILEDVRNLTEKLDTNMNIRDNAGIIEIN